MKQAKQPSRAFLLLAASSVSVFLGACASRGGPVLYDVPVFNEPDAELRNYPRTQLIGPLDELGVNVFQVEELSGNYKVNQAGQLTLPLIGTVLAQGLTPSEVAEQITRLLSRDYMRDPIVQVAIVEAAQKTFTLDGAVRSPGAYPLSGQTTLMEAVAIGNGLAPEANPSRVVVFRTIDGKRMAAAFDLQEIRRAESEDPVVYGNDIIIVDGDRIRAAWRDLISAISVIGIFRPFG